MEPTKINWWRSDTFDVKREYRQTTSRGQLKIEKEVNHGSRRIDQKAKAKARAHRKMVKAQKRGK